METRGGAQERNRDGGGGGNESSSRYGNGDEDGNGDGNKDGIGEGGGNAKKRKKPHKNCRDDQTLLFCTCHRLCRQGVARMGTRQLRSQGLVPVHAHRTEGVIGSGAVQRLGGGGGGAGM